ncbi:hypothetical protein X733_31030 [Mesorhizobium sp. L2C067A000]|nr:hypothetical protein X733_31030 [Mesorhizobium sp. L2C067A000]
MVIGTHHTSPSHSHTTGNFGAFYQRAFVPVYFVLISIDVRQMQAVCLCEMPVLTFETANII